MKNYAINKDDINDTKDNSIEEDNNDKLNSSKAKALFKD